MVDYTSTGQGRGRGGSGGGRGGGGVCVGVNVGNQNFQFASITERVYSTVSGYFEYDGRSPSYEQNLPQPLEEFIHADVLKPHVKHESTDCLPKHFGLKKSSWAELIQDLHELIEGAPPNVSYKLFFLGRHGEADNNAIAGGTNELDAELTVKGRSQARDVNVLWSQEIGEGIPVPHTLYCSPLRRTMETCGITFNRLRQGTDTELQFRRVLLEDLREQHGNYLCDKRRPHSFLRFLYEETFADEDSLWTPKAENGEHFEARVRRVVNHIFSTNNEIVISITAHDGTLHNFFKVINHPLAHSEKHVPTGGVVATVVKCVTNVVEATYRIVARGGGETGEYLPGSL